MTRRVLFAALLLGGHAGPLLAAPLDLPIDPRHAGVSFRAYALGLFPVDGAFTRFDGTLTIDPVKPYQCHVTVTVEIASLAMDDPQIRTSTLSPDLLDAAAFPQIHYDGVCQDRAIVGRLTLHGMTRPLTLTIRRDGAAYSAEAQIRRADWAITGRPVLAGPTIRIRVSTVLPP